MKPKFRAWDIENNKMYGCYGFDGLNERIYRCNLADTEFRAGHLETIYAAEDDLDNFELMQSTGLKDKNGVEIFEGDIIKTKTGTLQSVEYVRASVTKDWSETVAAFKCRQGDEYFYFDLATDEVIGNIYENPELLEVEGK